MVGTSNLGSWNGNWYKSLFYTFVLITYGWKKYPHSPLSLRSHQKIILLLKPFVDIIISLCLVKSPKRIGTFAQHTPKKLRVEPLNLKFSPLFMNLPDSYPIHIPFILCFSGLVCALGRFSSPMGQVCCLRCCARPSMTPRTMMTSPMACRSCTAWGGEGCDDFSGPPQVRENSVVYGCWICWWSKKKAVVI